MCNRREWFTDYVLLATQQPIYSESGHVIYAIGLGSFPLESSVYGKSIEVKLTNVLHVPQLKQNLISIGKLTDQGLEARFTSEGVRVFRKGKIVAVGDRADERLYRMRLEFRWKARRLNKQDSS